MTNLYNKELLTEQGVDVYATDSVDGHTFLGVEQGKELKKKSQLLVELEGEVMMFRVGLVEDGYGYPKSLYEHYFYSNEVDPKTVLELNHQKFALLVAEEEKAEELGYNTKLAYDVEVELEGYNRTLYVPNPPSKNQTLVVPKEDGTHMAILVTDVDRKGKKVTGELSPKVIRANFYYHEKTEHNGKDVIVLSESERPFFRNNKAETLAKVL